MYPHFGPSYHTPTPNRHGDGTACGLPADGVRIHANPHQRRPAPCVPPGPFAPPAQREQARLCRAMILSQLSREFYQTEEAEYERQRLLATQYAPPTGGFRTGDMPRDRADNGRQVASPYAPAPPSAGYDRSDFEAPRDLMQRPKFPDPFLAQPQCQLQRVPHQHDAPEWRPCEYPAPRPVPHRSVASPSVNRRYQSHQWDIPANHIFCAHEGSPATVRQEMSPASRVYNHHEAHIARKRSPSCGAHTAQSQPEYPWFASSLYPESHPSRSDGPSRERGLSGGGGPRSPELCCLFSPSQVPNASISPACPPLAQEAPRGEGCPRP